MTLLWAIAWAESIHVGMPELCRKVTDQYLSLSWLLSKTTFTFIPFLYASNNALAIGADVKEYACIRMEDLASLNSLTIASVHPLFGEK